MNDTKYICIISTLINQICSVPSYFRNETSVSLFFFFKVLMHFCLSCHTEHVRGIHTFGGCILLTCQVSMVRVQAVWEDWELARGIGDGEEARISQV